MRAGLFRFYLTAILVFAFATIWHPLPSTAETGGELVQLFRPFPGHFNSAIDDDLSVASAASQIFVSLLEIGEKGDIQPYLANWWDISEDGKTYTFYLQRETVFHDEKPVTSSDVVFSYETFRQYHPLGERMFRHVESVEALDSLTFVIHLSSADPALLYCLATPFMPIMPQHVYGSVDMLQKPANIKAVGSGPFRMIAYRAGETFVLERFDAYLRPGRPIMDRIIGLSAASPYYAVSAMNNGAAHLFTFVEQPEIINLLSDNNSLRITSTGYEQIGAMNLLAFNLRKKPLKALKVRQAIAHAIDLEHIGATVFEDYALALNGPLPLNSPFFKDGAADYPLDLETAEQLLDEAEFPRAVDGIRFSTRLTWAPDHSGSQQKVAAYIKSQLEKIGIDVTLDVPKNYIEWHIQVAKWQHHMTLTRVFEWGDPTINLQPLFSSKHLVHHLGSNTSGFFSKQADILLEAAEKEMNLGIRSELYRQFQILAREELPLYFMHEAPFVTIIHQKLQDFPVTGRGVIGPLDRISWKETETTGELGSEDGISNQSGYLKR